MSFLFPAIERDTSTSRQRVAHVTGQLALHQASGDYVAKAALEKLLERWTESYAHIEEKAAAGDPTPIQNAYFDGLLKALNVAIADLADVVGPEIESQR